MLGFGIGGNNEPIVQRVSKRFLLVAVVLERFFFFFITLGRCVILCVCVYIYIYYYVAPRSMLFQEQATLT